MLTNEEQEIMNKLKETARNIYEEYGAGRMSKEEYWSKLKLIDEAEETIKEMSEEQ